MAAVDELLRQPDVAALLETHPREVVVEAARAVTERLRREILDGGRAVNAGELTAAIAGALGRAARRDGGAARRCAA